MFEFLVVKGMSGAVLPSERKSKQSNHFKVAVTSFFFLLFLLSTVDLEPGFSFLNALLFCMYTLHLADVGSLELSLSPPTWFFLRCVFCVFCFVLFFTCFLLFFFILLLGGVMLF